MLNKRQKLTIEHLKFINKIENPEEIIDWCYEKLSKPHAGAARKKNQKLGLPNPSRSETRKHKQSHYIGIIKHFEGVR